jgi:hypothetical protein
MQIFQIQYKTNFMTTTTATQREIETNRDKVKLG